MLGGGFGGVEAKCTATAALFRLAWHKCCFVAAMVQNAKSSQCGHRDAIDPALANWNRSD
jgi:hypothetical protein